MATKYVPDTRTRFAQRRTRGRGGGRARGRKEDSYYEEFRGSHVKLSNV